MSCCYTMTLFANFMYRLFLKVTKNKTGCLFPDLLPVGNACKISYHLKEN